MRPRSEPKIVGSVPWRPSDRLDVGKTRDSLGIGDRLHPAANDDAPTGLLLLIHAVDLGGGARWTVRGWDRVLASHDIKRGAGSPDVLTRGRRTASPDPQPLLNHPNRLRVPLTPRSPRPRTGVPRDQSVARSSSMCRSAQTCRPVSGWTTAPPRSRRSERPRPRQVPTESSRRERTQPGSRTPTRKVLIEHPRPPERTGYATNGIRRGRPASDGLRWGLPLRQPSPSPLPDRADLRVYLVIDVLEAERHQNTR